MPSIQTFSNTTIAGANTSHISATARPAISAAAPDRRGNPRAAFSTLRGSVMCR